MRLILASLTLFMLHVSCNGQTIGIGIGTTGFNLKSPPGKRVKGIVRVNPLFTQFPAIVNVGAMMGGNIVSEENGDLYIGLGAGTANTEYASIVEQNFWYVNLPIGLELFPFSNKKISFAAEAGPLYDNETSDSYPPRPQWRLGFRGLFEFSFYF